MQQMQQYERLNEQIESVFEMQSSCFAKGESADFADDFGFNLARRILGDFKLRIDAYADNAFALSDKQVAFIEKAIEVNRQGFEELLDAAAAGERVKIAAEAAFISEFFEGAEMPDDLYRAARQVVRGQIGRFEAKLWLARERAAQDQRAAEYDVYGAADQGGPFPNRHWLEWQFA